MIKTIINKLRYRCIKKALESAPDKEKLSEKNMHRVSLWYLATGDLDSSINRVVKDCSLKFHKDTAEYRCDL